MQNNNDLEKAIKLLKENGYTCAIVKGEKCYFSELRGVKPLLLFLNSNTDLAGFSAADKVVGRAAAYLYVLLGIVSVYADVISEAAAEVFDKYKIAYSCDKEVMAIRNRDNTGFCPMETAVLNIDNPNDAEIAIRNKLKELSGK